MKNVDNNANLHQSATSLNTSSSTISPNNDVDLASIITKILKANTKKGKTTIKLEIEFSDE